MGAEYVMGKRFTVSDGKLMLYLWPAAEGGYNVTSPLDPALITQADTLEEAFVMAYDAQKCLRTARAKLAQRREAASPKQGKSHSEVQTTSKSHATKSTPP